LRPFGLLCIGLWTAVAGASEVRKSDVYHQGARYSVHVESTIDAPVASVRAVITDYDHLDRVHHSVLKSKRLGRNADGDRLVRLLMQPCMLFFCFDTVQVTAFRTLPNGDLRAVIDKTHSDFSYGLMTWQFHSPTPETTGIVFHGEIEPSFWLPPIIGPWLLESTLLTTATDIVDNLELLAARRAR
jgi:hypothetical protein